jgi:hypothetical protein
MLRVEEALRNAGVKAVGQPFGLSPAFMLLSFSAYLRNGFFK